MKKYLMTGIAAVAMCAAFTSCSKDTEFEQITESDVLKAQYDAAFIKTFGQPAANQDWGFGTTTRVADVNSNEWVAKGYNVSKAVTAGERDTVMTYFRTTRNPISETVDIQNFFVLNVGYSDAVYTTTARNGNTITITNPGQSHMDWIFCGPGYNENNQLGDDHINNLNANSGQIQHMKNSGSEYFGFHDSYGTDHQEGKTEHRYCQVNRNFVLRFIEHGGQVDLYVGLNYESGKTNEEGWHINPDAYFSDRVLKLVPGEGNWFDGRIMAEDLSASEGTDFDFNDVVFDYKLTNTGATICLLAAGGTLELKIGDAEVHDKFGVSTNTMVNTGVNGSSNVQPVIFTIPGSFATANDIPVKVLKGTNWETLYAKRGEPACKLNVPTYTRWVDEYVNINKAYTWFDNWVQTAGATDWAHPVMRFVDRDLSNNN